MITLKTEQALPLSPEKAWDFFSSPKNLNKITPEDMRFRFSSNLPEKMYQGLIIIYKISPFLNLSFDWVTEITHVQEPFYFVDEQRKGPFRIWHHEHHFQKIDSGVLMTDILHYEVGKFFVGTFAEKIFINRKIRKIFEYRTKKLKKLFANPPADKTP